MPLLPSLAIMPLRDGAAFASALDTALAFPLAAIAHFAQHMRRRGVICNVAGSTYNMDSGDWTSAAVAAAVADSPNPDILLSPHCSEEELTMLLEALSQPTDVAAATSSVLPPAPQQPAPIGHHMDKGPLEKSPLGREAALNPPVMG